MPDDPKGLFDERAPRPRARPSEAATAGSPEPSPGPVSAPPPAPGQPAAGLPPVDTTEVLREVRQGVRATVDEWLSERSNTVSLAVAQVVEDALTRLHAAHAARIRELTHAYEERLAAAERERAEVLRGAMRRRRARARAVERDLRAKVESLERALTEASLEGVERLRDVERRESERRAELERAQADALRQRDEEIARLRRGGASGDSTFDALHEQLRSRRPGGHEH